MLHGKCPKCDEHFTELNRRQLAHFIWEECVCHMNHSPITLWRIVIKCIKDLKVGDKMYGTGYRGSYQIQLVGMKYVYSS
jgi:hypothetical protein